MIVPVRCLSCGKVIGNKYYHYKKEVAALKAKYNITNNELTTININQKEVTKTIEGKVLDKLGITKDCCRTKIMYHLEFN